MVCKRFCCIFLLLIFMLLLPLPAFSNGQVPIITKNPTSEALSAGGKTWFIAHADNATSMSWELVDPNGTVYTLANAMAMNPGLNLQALEGDTIAVSNAPTSINGWGVQATFYGPGGSVSTSPAYIYVGDFLTAYFNVIEKYRVAKQINIRGAGDADQYEVSEWIVYYDHVGYALKDLDKNGIPELLIAGIGPKYEDNHVLFEVYTLENNYPIQLLISWARSRKYLTYDNRIYEEGSSGAAYTNMDFYKVNGAFLVFDEAYTTYILNDYENAGRALYHFSTANKVLDGRTYYGDYSIPDATYSIDYLSPLYEQFESQCWMPQLTMIA